MPRNWLNLLLLDTSNRRDHNSSVEDKENKPWRPIPAGNLAVDETRWLTFLTCMAAVLASINMGRLVESLTLIVESWIYNELGGANNSFLAKSTLNAAVTWHMLVYHTMPNSAERRCLGSSS